MSVCLIEKEVTSAHSSSKETSTRLQHELDALVVKHDSALASNRQLQADLTAESRNLEATTEDCARVREDLAALTTRHDGVVHELAKTQAALDSASGRLEEQSQLAVRQASELSAVKMELSSISDEKARSVSEWWRRAHARGHSREDDAVVALFIVAGVLLVVSVFACLFDDVSPLYGQEWS